MWAGHVSRMGERRDTYRVLVRRPEGKRLFERPGHWWEDYQNGSSRIDMRGGWTGLIWLRIETGGGSL